MGNPTITITEALALVRRYAVAVAEGRIEAKKLASMTDEELKTIEADAFTAFEAKQKEAEQLARES